MEELLWYESSGEAGPALRRCLLAATAAPSVHNTQPWLFGVSRNGFVDVLVDRDRQLRDADPEGRELLLSVGAALFNLRVSIRALGRAALVRFRPDPERSDVVARVTIGPPAPAAAELAALAAAIPHRHTNRRPFADEPVPDRHLEELRRAVQAEGAELLVADPPLTAGILALTRTADHRLSARHAYRAELAAWTTPGGVGRRDGVPRQAFGPRDVHGALPLRDFGAAHGDATSVVRFERDPTLLLVRTAGDGPARWLTAGLALQRLWLTATVRGLAVTPLSQAIEVPALRTLLDESASDLVVQTVLRIGRATVGMAATPRRPLAEVLLPGYRGSAPASDR
ncbi:Acg family FMN-binding oxidoreductase [Plantactinospora siamensis]|uniref:Acg family FMN-binding oxidoreductase n=1 Tax=Plantactinospora siamensis TaxID=555372 RepID=A0ABV6P4B5_9ACTN